jgi:hypothetical protein
MVIFSPYLENAMKWQGWGGILIGDKHNQLLTHNYLVRNLTYEENSLKEDIVNIYQKPLAFLNYFIDTFSH